MKENPKLSIYCDTLYKKLRRDILALSNSEDDAHDFASKGVVHFLEKCKSLEFNGEGLTDERVISILGGTRRFTVLEYFRTLNIKKKMTCFTEITEEIGTKGFIGYNELLQNTTHYLPYNAIIIREGFKNLPEDTQQILYNHYFQGLSLKEIAEEEKISETAAKVRLFRARNKLAYVLKEEK